MIKYLVLIFVLISSPVLSADRCVDFIADVRSAHSQYFGPTFPYWYGVAQLKQESACRPDITSFDGGMGIAQFMPKTSEYVQSLMRQKLNPYNPSDATRMQAFYVARIHKKENWTKKLWITYQIYNGGKTLLYREYLKAGKDDHDLMRAHCSRKVITIKNSTLDMCDVNYDYSLRIFKYSKPYKRGEDTITYW